jgi:hypothetical protein
MFFGNLDEFYHDESGSVYGPDVKVILKLRVSGDTVIKYIPAALAVVFVLYNDIENGDIYSSARIDFGNLIDVWGGSV